MMLQHQSWTDRKKMLLSLTPHELQQGTFTVLKLNEEEHGAFGEEYLIEYVLKEHPGEV